MGGFPMMVLPVSRVLKLECLPRHEEIKDELVEWCDDDMPTLFVSQTWLTYEHPDNKANDKLLLLQHFLREAAAGKMVVHGSMEAEITYGKKVLIPAAQTKKIAYVWFDIFSGTPHDRPLTQSPRPC